MPTGPEPDKCTGSTGPGDPYYNQFQSVELRVAELARVQTVQEIPAD